MQEECEEAAWIEEIRARVGSWIRECGKQREEFMAILPGLATRASYLVSYWHP